MGHIVGPIFRTIKLKNKKALDKVSYSSLVIKIEHTRQLYSTVINDNGNVINDNGNVINDNGNVINDNGIVINDNGNVINDNGIVINDNGIEISDNGIVTNRQRQCINS